MNQTISLRFSIFFQLLVIFTFTYANKFLYVLFAGVLVYALVKRNSLLTQLTNSERIIWPIYVGLTLFMMVLNFFREPIVAFHFLMANITFLAAIFFTRSPLVYYKASKVSLLAFQIFVIVAILFAGFDNFPVDVPLEKVVPGSSANGITSYLIVLQINYCIISFLLFRRIPYLTILLTISIAMTGYGRGSIISSLAILVVSLLINAARKGGAVFFLTIGSIVGIVLTAAIFFYDEIYFFIAANTKLTAGIQDASRIMVIEQYLAKMDGFTFFFGADYSNTTIEQYLNGNPHNSFIRGHHFFGLPYLLFILVFPIYAILRRRYMIEWVYYSLLVIIFMFRIFSEPIVFPTLLDFYVWAIFLLVARKDVAIIDRQKEQHVPSLIA
jgi:hypothetical protein